VVPVPLKALLLVFASLLLRYRFYAHSRSSSFLLIEMHDYAYLELPSYLRSLCAMKCPSISAHCF
jgi:hypothetical protein